MAQDPNQIREEIEETRSRMGDKVDAIGYKADVPSRAREYVSDKAEAVVSKVRGATPDTGQVSGQVRQGAQRAGGIARENPLGLGIAGAALGFLAGLLLPSTRVEDERLGEAADRVKEQAKETGQEALERGRTVAQEAAQSAAETARERGQQEQQELTESLRERTQQSGGSQGPGSPEMSEPPEMTQPPEMSPGREIRQPRDPQERVPPGTIAP